MAKRKCLWYFSFDMALIFWWSGSNVSLIQSLFQPRILSLTEEKDIYLGCLAMTKKPTCDNSTLEALMRLFLPAHDHKLSLLISLLGYPRMAWYALAGPSPLLVSKAWIRSVAYLPNHDSFESYCCKRIRRCWFRCIRFLWHWFYLFFFLVHDLLYSLFSGIQTKRFHLDWNPGDYTKPFFQRSGVIIAFFLCSNQVSREASERVEVGESG